MANSQNRLEIGDKENQMTWLSDPLQGVSARSLCEEQQR